MNNTNVNKIYSERKEISVKWSIDIELNQSNDFWRYFLLLLAKDFIPAIARSGILCSIGIVFNAAATSEIVLFIEHVDCFLSFSIMNIPLFV